MDKYNEQNSTMGQHHPHNYYTRWYQTNFHFTNGSRGIFTKSFFFFFFFFQFLIFFSPSWPVHWKVYLLGYGYVFWSTRGDDIYKIHTTGYHLDGAYHGNALASVYPHPTNPFYLLMTAYSEACYLPADQQEGLYCYISVSSSLFSFFFFFSSFLLNVRIFF